MKKKTTAPTWAESIRKARKGVTVREAATLIPHLSRRTWEAWEAGRMTPPPWVQGLIIAALTPSVPASEMK